MLATLVDKPFDRPGWIFEPKWDGFRAIAEVAPKHVRLYSRNQGSFDKKFAPVVRSLEELGHEAVLDGEVVVVDEAGISHFQLLQNYQKTGKGQLIYYVFDILYLDGHDLQGLPLIRRKELLEKCLGPNNGVRLSEHIEDNGVALFQAAKAHHLEGIVAKNGQSVYRQETRGRDWLKIKTHLRQEAVIGGFTEPRQIRKHLGALILGVYEDGELIYIGRTGGGFDAKELADVRKKIEPLIRRTSPFRSRPKSNAPVHWVEPEFVCEVSFQEWTASGLLRQPIFLGFREDKPAQEVHRETPEAASQGLKRDKNARNSARSAAPGRNSVENASGAEPRVRLTHLDKIYWPDENYSKGDLVEYYRDVAPLILPYLRDRPESLHRHPDGIDGKSFFQKDVSQNPPPDWVETVQIRSDSDGKNVIYIVCQTQDSLLYMVNLGCIELNPWNSRLGSLENPDYLVIDLDPEKISFAHVIETARTVRRVLEKVGVESVCKTSGKTGLHIYVPLGARYGYEQAKQFAEIVANVAQRDLPESTSVLRSPAKRQGRVYLDFLQNHRGQTLAAPYSVRPVSKAPVSTPLKWHEVTRALDPTKFTIRTIRKRIDKVGDLWEPVLGEGVDLEDCLNRLASLSSPSKSSMSKRTKAPKRRKRRP
jgi:bifunctional non-homologous end joining protein LigD